MKISYNWLKEFAPIELHTTDAAEILTDLGLEIEGIESWESLKGGLRGVVIGKVLTCQAHPNSDHLHITTVDIGSNTPLQIVCGASNIAAGQTVPVATIGTVLYDKEGKEFVIRESKIRGELSQGMICAEDELGIGSSHEGIMVLDSVIKEGTPAAEVFGIENDSVFEIGLTPNRADAMSHLGCARDLAARLNYKGQNIDITLPDCNITATSDSPVKVSVLKPSMAPRYSGIVVRGVKVAPSPQWLINRIHAVGLSPINNIVDITNYVLQSLGQPLHAFDLRQVADEIIVKTCPEGTPFTTLDGVERKLNADDLMICNSHEPMCMAGVYGGIKSGIKNDTTDIFIESAYFDPVSIRKTSKRHGLKTDASFRYERGIDPNITLKALGLAARLIEELAGGKVASHIIDICEDKSMLEPFDISLRVSHVGKLLGQNIPVEELKRILTALEIEIINQKEDILQIKVPAYRVDVQREADVVEEILRVYGYNEIQVSPYLHTSIVSDDKHDPEYLFNIVADQLASQGWAEMMSNSLTKNSYTELTQTIDPDTTVGIINPLSSDLDVLRQSLLFGGLEAVARNINFRNTNLNLFELGKVYNKFSQGYIEDRHIVLLSTGKQTTESWLGDTQEVSFYTLRSTIDRLLERLGITGLSTKPCSDDYFAEGIELYHKKTLLAKVGNISKKLLKRFDISQAVFYGDIIWENVIILARNSHIVYQEISKYPSVRRDLALLVDQSVSYQDLYNIAMQTERVLLKQVNLFDVYQGDKLPSGKKSYALSFILADEDKTLDDKKIDTTMTKLQAAFVKHIGAELRS